MLHRKWLKTLCVGLLLVSMVSMGAAGSLSFGSYDDSTYEGERGSSYDGVIFEPKKDMLIESVQLFNPDEGDSDTVYLSRRSDGKILGSTSMGSDKAVFDDVSVEANTKYVIYALGSAYDTSASFPYSNTDVEAVTGVYGLNSDGTGGTESSTNVYLYWKINYGLNDPPSFNSTSSNQCLIGENCSYSAEASDSDGNISYTNLTVKRTNLSDLDVSVLDDFEDGDVSGWSVSQGAGTTDFSADSNAISGSYSGMTYSNNGYGYITSPSTGGVKERVKFELKIGSDTGSSSDGVNYRLYDTDGTNIGELLFQDSSRDVKFATPDGYITVADNFWNTDQEYTVTLIPDYSASSVEILIDGTSYGSYQTSSGFDNFDYLEIQVDTSNSGATRNTWIDDVRTVDPVTPVTVVEDVQRSDTTTPEWNDILEINYSEVWYNATFETVDNDGAVTTASLDRFLSDNPPNVDLQNPGNQTYFRYDVPLDFEASDGDNKAGEEYQCDIEKDGQLVDEALLVEGSNASYSGSISSDLGQHNVSVSCTDPAGNTGSSSESYTVKASEVESVFSSSPVYETVNESFQLDLKTGGMVNSVDFTLMYNGTAVGSTSMSSSGVEVVKPTLFHEVPLVESNQTSKNWKYSFDLNISEYQSSNTSILQKDTGSQSQLVYWSYWLKNQSLTQPRYAGGADIKYRGYVENTSSKASVTGKVKNSQKDNFYDLVQDRKSNSLSKYSQVIPTEYINQSSLEVNVTSSYSVSFKDMERDFNEDIIVSGLDHLDFGLCSNVNGEKALEFTTYLEKNRSTKKTSVMNFASEFWHPDSPDVTKVANFSNTAQAHDICLTPGYTEIVADSTDKLIQYTDDGDDYVLRSYFLVDERLDNSTTNIPLYMLPKNESSRVRFTVENENREKVSDAVVRIQRYFPSEDKELTTAMVKTGSQGETETFLEVNEIYYSFEVYRDGELVEVVPQQVIPSDLTMTITIGDDDVPDWYDYEGKTSSTCDYNGTQVTCSYSSSTEALDNVTLAVYRNEMIGESLYNISVGRTTSGTLTVKGFNASKSRYTYELKAYYNSGISEALQIQSLGNMSKPLGETGVMISLFLFLSMSFAGLWKPSASIALGTFSIIISTFLPFLALSQTALTALVALAAVFIWRMS